jgi:hypothetical protein
MTKFSHITLAAIFAAFLAVIGMAPAQAASFPAGSAAQVERAGQLETQQVQYRRHYHRRAYYGPRRHYRRAYYGRPYYARPVYYRRCVTRPRVVWTPYGYVRRWVRVCR